MERIKPNCRFVAGKLFVAVVLSRIVQALCLTDLGRLCAADTIFNRTETNELNL